ATTAPQAESAIPAQQTQAQRRRPQLLPLLLRTACPPTCSVRARQTRAGPEPHVRRQKPPTCVQPIPTETAASDPGWRVAGPRRGTTTRLGQEDGFVRRGRRDRPLETRVVRQRRRTARAAAPSGCL